MFIDSHSHISSKELLGDIDSLILRSNLAKVNHIINVCTDKETLEEGLKIAKKYPQVYTAAATTPHDAKKVDDFLPIVKQAVEQNQLIAIGETGLDYYYEHSPREIQKKCLIDYCKTALHYDLPLIIHCREAFTDLFELCQEFYNSEKAVLHCFTGVLQEAKEVLERGWLISFSGIITFPKSNALREVVKYVPLDRILIETDSPYLAPNSKRGKLNEPAFLPETAEKIAELKNISIEKVAETTSLNAKNLFKIA